MKFTIITVALNAGEKLKQTIQSVLDQSYGNWEVVIKDGMSTDGSIEACPKEERIRVVSKPDKSIYDAMNQAVQEAKGEYILFLNCGDFFYNSEVLAEIAKATDLNPERGIYYGNAYFRTAKEVLHMPPKITAFTCFRHIPCHQACVFETALFQKDCFRTEYRIRADYDFFLRQFFVNHVNPCAMDLTVADYEGGGFSETKENLKKDKKEHNEIIHKYMNSGQIFKYKLIMVVTLQPLRRFIAQKSVFAGTYDKLKRSIYRQEGKK